MTWLAIFGVIIGILGPAIALLVHFHNRKEQSISMKKEGIDILRSGLDLLHEGRHLLAQAQERIAQHSWYDDAKGKSYSEMIRKHESTLFALQHEIAESATNCATRLHIAEGGHREFLSVAKAFQVKAHDGKHMANDYVSVIEYSIRADESLSVAGNKLNEVVAYVEKIVVPAIDKALQALPLGSPRYGTLVFARKDILEQLSVSEFCEPNNEQKLIDVVRELSRIVAAAQAVIRYAHN